MYISARERMILEILLAKSEEMTVRDLADEIDVSVRTIHRDLKGIEDILKDYGLSLVKNQESASKLLVTKQKLKS